MRSGDERVKGGRHWLWLALSVIACAVSWSYMHRILLPWEQYINVTHGRLRAQMGDLYPRWVGTRELLINKLDPYGPEVSHKIQIAFYGHIIEQNYQRPASEIVDEQRFVYPIYVVFLLAPTIHVEFDALQLWAPGVLAAVTWAGVWFWMGVLRWKPPAWLTISIMLFILASPQVAQGLRLRQFGLLVAFLIALAAWCVTRQQYLLAGILLAFSTVKPQMVLLLIAFFLLWSLAELRSRWPVLAGFTGTLVLLIGLGELLLPGWPLEFLRGLEAYRRYFPTTSPLRLLLGDWAGGALSFLIVVGLFAFTWRNRKASSDSLHFVEMLSLVLIVTALVLPLLTPYNQVLLLLPTLLVLRDWKSIPQVGRIAFSALVLWPWATELILLGHPPSIESTSRLPLLPASLALLYPFLVSGLMFVYMQRSE